MTDALNMWVVYDNPKDVPAGYRYVVRQRRVLGGGKEEVSLRAFATKTLDDARRVVPPGLQLIPRFPDDDPVILEVWL